MLVSTFVVWLATHTCSKGSLPADILLDITTVSPFCLHECYQKPEEEIEICRVHKLKKMYGSRRHSAILLLLYTLIFVREKAFTQRKKRLSSRMVMKQDRELDSLSFDSSVG